MKLFHLTLAMLGSFITSQAQIGLGAFQIKDGKVYDTCVVYKIFYPNTPIQYMIIGAWKEDEDLTNNLIKKMDNGFIHLSTYFISSERFTLDFIPLGELDAAHRELLGQRPIQKIKEVRLQFMVSHNGQVIIDWSDISTLGRDPDFQPGMSEQIEGKPTKLIAWKHYCAGKFQLNRNNSLVVLIRDPVTKQTVKSIFIKRILFFPQHFDFITFPSGADLRSVWSGMTKKETDATFYSDSITRFEMGQDESAVLKFYDPRIQSGELEYAYADHPGEWKTLRNSEDSLRNTAFILLQKPPPGKTIELLLRYKHREGMQRIIINVGEKLTGTTWFKLTATLAVAVVLFTGFYLFKRNAHAKQLRWLTLTKEEMESKLQSLSGQLNSHFLFNSLNSVQNLIHKNDTKSATLYVSEVSSFLRTILEAGKKEFISLQEELIMEEAYLKLEQKRKKLEYRIVNQCHHDLSQVEFPPSLLQPIIENSIHHGFRKNVENPLITIEIRCLQKQLLVSVTDNGHGFDSASQGFGTGLSIVQKRISLLNEKYSDMLTKMEVASAGTGTTTTFTFENWL